MSHSPPLSPLVYGTMGFHNPSAAERIRVIHCAIDHGMTSIDTAPLYGCGEAERIVGEAISDRRERVQILTKCGLRWDTEEGTPLFAAMADGKSRMIRRNCRPDSIRQEVEQSLRRLQIDCIDLIQVHRWDPDVPIEETIGALVGLREAGKVQGIGLSDHPENQMRRAQQALEGGLTSTQNEYNLVRRDHGRDALNFSRDNELFFIAYSSLAQGVLAGRQLQGAAVPKDDRAESEYYHPSNLAKVEKVLLEAAQPIAESYGATLSQLSLACLLKLPGVTNAIAGGRTESQVKENAQALSLEIKQTDVERLNAAFIHCDWQSNPDATKAQRLKEKTRSFLSRVKRKMIN